MGPVAQRPVRSTKILPEAPDDVRVVVVDDSAVVRHVVSEVIGREEGVTLAALATNGKEAVTAVECSNPHVVVLDVEMPVMDGLGALRELKRRWPKLPVIMFSTLTERGAAATLEALAEGADDYMTKPVSTSGPAGAFEAVHEGLVPLLRSWGNIARSREARQEQRIHKEGPVTSRPGTSPAAPLARPSGFTRTPLALPTLVPAPPSAAPFHLAPGAPGGPPPSAPSKTLSRAVPTSVPARRLSPVVAAPPASGVKRAQASVGAVVIGSSTGGPNALGLVVPQLPGDFPVPVLVVQHMPPTFTRLLAERLNVQSPLTVHEAEAGMVARPGHVYVAAGGSHMVVGRSGQDIVIKLDDGAPENSCKPSVDVLFRSAAAVWGAGVLGVVLTGMGQDGLVGAQVIVSVGGVVIAQDEASSVVWGMPGAVVKAGLAAEVAPIGDIAANIVKRARRDSSARAATSSGGRREGERL
jgi:two-component system chemotaxis response regulator CheB